MGLDFSCSVGKVSGGLVNDRRRRPVCTTMYFDCDFFFSKFCKTCAIICVIIFNIIPAFRLHVLFFFTQNFLLATWTVYEIFGGWAGSARRGGAGLWDGDSLDSASSCRRGLWIGQQRTLCKILLINQTLYRPVSF